MRGKILSIILLVCFVSREAAAVVPIAETSPVQLSAEQMSRLMNHPSVRVKQILLTQAETQNPEETAKKKVKEKEDDDFEDFIEKDAVDHNYGMNTWLNFSGSDGLYVAFAIVGLVMVIAWLAAFPYTVYKAIADKEEFQNLQMINLNYSRFEDADLVGTRYSLYLADPEEGILGNSMGFSAEVGHYHYREKGEYWMLGPSFLWGFSTGSHYAFWKLELMAGSDFHSQIGLLSKGEVSLNFEVSRRLSLGLGIGGIYLESSSSSATTFSDDHKLGYLYGANATYLF